MVKVKKIDTPKPKKTKLYWETVLSSSNIFKRWYAKKPVIITLLVFLLPVGLFLMWKFAEWSKKTKWVVSSAFILLWAIALIGGYNTSPSISVANANADKISTDNAEYALTGDVSSMKAATLTIDNQNVTLSKDSKFSYKVTLQEGENAFNLVASNENGKIKKTVTVRRTTQAEFAARAKAEAKNKTDAKAKAEANASAAAAAKAQAAEAKNKTDAKAKAEANASAAAAAKAQAEAQAQHKAYIDSADNNAFYINNVYFKGDGKYDIVVYSSNRDTLQIYVNDKNPVKTKVNKEGWATFKKVKLTGRSKLSFAKKVGWFKYYPVNYVKYISVDSEQVKLMDANAIAALEKAEAVAKAAQEKAVADAKAAAAAKAQAEAQAQHKAYIDGLASTYCSNHNGWRNIYVPQSTSRDTWGSPNKDLQTKYPSHSNCVIIMTFFVDTMPSKYTSNIINAKVGSGMNKAEVLAAWGWPSDNSNYSSGWGSSGTWTWDTGTCYYGVCPHQQYATFYNGTVDSTGNY